MSPRKLNKLIKRNPELKYVINYYDRYPRNACLKRLLRKLYMMRKGKRVIALSFLGGLADLITKKRTVH